MFALFAVGAAGVVDGFAAGLYIGHRWTKARLKEKVIEAEKATVITIQEAASAVERDVAPAVTEPQIPSYDASGAVVPLDAKHAHELALKRSEEGKPR